MAEDIDHSTRTKKLETGIHKQRSRKLFAEKLSVALAANPCVHANQGLFLGFLESLNPRLLSTAARIAAAKDGAGSAELANEKDSDYRKEHTISGYVTNIKQSANTFRQLGRSARWRIITENKVHRLVLEEDSQFGAGDLSHEPIASLATTAAARPVVFEYVGSDSIAIKHLVDEYSTRPLSRVRDTHSRSADSIRDEAAFANSAEDYEKLWAAFKTAAKRRRIDTTIVIGWETDPDYLSRLVDLASKPNDLARPAEIRRLRVRGPVLNFIILDYDPLGECPRERVVLFGWGQKSGLAGSVYKSSHPAILGEFERMFEYLLLTSDRVETAEEIKAQPHANVHCTYVGTSDMAMQEILERVASQRVRKIKDTHVFRDPRSVFEEPFYQSWKIGIDAFLKRRGSKFYQIIGTPLDQKYITQTFELAESASKEALSIRLLPGRTPIMNFMLLEGHSEHGDTKTEVYFGWGRHLPGDNDWVFRSDDRSLTKAFADYFEALESASDKTESLRDIHADDSRHGVPWLYELYRLNRAELSVAKESIIYYIADSLEVDAESRSTQEVVERNLEHGVMYRYVTSTSGRDKRNYASRVHGKYGARIEIKVHEEFFRQYPIYSALILVDSDRPELPEAFLELPQRSERGSRCWIKADTNLSHSWKELAEKLWSEGTPYPGHHLER